MEIILIIIVAICIIGFSIFIDKYSDYKKYLKQVKNYIDLQNIIGKDKVFCKFCEYENTSCLSENCRYFFKQKDNIRYEINFVTGEIEKHYINTIKMDKQNINGDCKFFKLKEKYLKIYNKLVKND